MIVHVKDTGAGIAPEDMPKLFSRFGKLHRTAEMNHEGIGLGLTIVKQIVESCGGEISVSSEGLGHGCVFCFTMKMRTFEEGEDGEGRESGEEGEDEEEDDFRDEDVV